MAHSARLPMGENNEQSLPMGHGTHLSKSDAHYLDYLNLTSSFAATLAGTQVLQTLL